MRQSKKNWARPAPVGIGIRSLNLGLRQRAESRSDQESATLSSRSAEAFALRSDSTTGRGRQLLSLLGEQDSEQLRGPGRTGVARDGVQLSRGFQKHLADRVRSFRLVTDLRSNLTLQDVGDRDSRMAMRR